MQSVLRSDTLASDAASAARETRMRSASLCRENVAEGGPTRQSGKVRTARRLLTAAVAAVAVAAGVVQLMLPDPAAAADLGHNPYTGRPETKCDVPWTTRYETPPRKGYWFYTQPVAPNVNFLVPCEGLMDARPAAWSPAWFDYCSRRWPSFNPRTGYIDTPDGRRMCV